MPEAVHHQLCRHGRARLQEARPLQRMAEAVGVVVEDEKPDSVHQRRQVVVAEGLGQPEVKEAHAAAAVEDVVARVRVAVEGVDPVQAAEHKPVDRLRGQVALALAPTLHLLEARARHEIRRQHARGAQLGHDMRHVDVWMALVVAREQLLAATLEAVIDLLLESLSELLHQRARVEAWKGGADDAPQKRHVAQVRGDAPGDPRVLDLDRHRAAVACDRAVHLTDRGGRKCERIPLREDLIRRGAELFGDHAGRHFRAHRGCRLLQPAHGCANRLRQVLVDVARHLTELHEHTTHGAELLGHVVRRAQGKVVSQLAPALDGREDQPGRARDVAAADAQREARERRAATGARLHHGSLGFLHDRARTSMRLRASITPSSDSKARSSVPSSWRTYSLSSACGGGMAKPYASRAQSGNVPVATWDRSCQSSRVPSSRPGGSSTTAIASRAAPVIRTSLTERRYSFSASADRGTMPPGTPTISANGTISAT